MFKTKEREMLNKKTSKTKENQKVARFRSGNTNRLICSSAVQSPRTIKPELFLCAHWPEKKSYYLFTQVFPLFFAPRRFMHFGKSLSGVQLNLRYLTITGTAFLADKFAHIECKSNFGRIQRAKMAIWENWPVRAERWSSTNKATSSRCYQLELFA